MTYEVNISDHCPAWWNNFKWDFLYNEQKRKERSLKFDDSKDAWDDELMKHNIKVIFKNYDVILVFPSEAEATMFVLRWT